MQPDATTRNDFLAVIELVDGIHVAHCAEIPGVEGRGRSKKAALKALGDSVANLLDERRQQAVLFASKTAVFDSIRVP